MKIGNTNTAICILFVLVALRLTATSSPAQCIAEDASILRARYKEGDATIYVSLSKRLNQADLSATGKPEQWHLDDLTSLARIPISDVQPDGLLDGETTSVIIVISVPLDMAHIYRLSAPSLTFLGCQTKEDEKPDTLVQKKKLPQPVSPGQPAPPPKKKNFFPMGKAEDRNDSNVYLAGSLEGARGGKPNFSADIKIEVPYVINPGKAIDVRPYFNLKSSTAKNGDSDSLNFGGKFRIPFNTSNSGPLRYVLWEPAGGFESDRRFGNVNLITSQLLTFGIPGNANTFKWRARILPYIGFELGRNLKSPVKAAEGRPISRGIVGSTFYLNYDRSEDSSFSFQVDYVRRFLLRREVSFTKDDDDKLIPLLVGKGPRDYLKATAEYDFSKFTGFTLGYEYGRLPPNFELVNHKYSLGLVFKFKTKFPGK